jgi:hypothetical protein
LELRGMGRPGQQSVKQLLQRVELRLSPGGWVSQWSKEHVLSLLKYIWQEKMASMK